MTKYLALESVGSGGTPLHHLSASTHHPHPPAVAPDRRFRVTHLLQRHHYDVTWAAKREIGPLTRSGRLRTEAYAYLRMLELEAAEAEAGAGHGAVVVGVDDAIRNASAESGAVLREGSDRGPPRRFRHRPRGPGFRCRDRRGFRAVQGSGQPGVQGSRGVQGARGVGTRAAVCVCVCCLEKADGSQPAVCHMITSPGPFPSGGVRHRPT